MSCHALYCRPRNADDSFQGPETPLQPLRWNLALVSGTGTVVHVRLVPYLPAEQVGLVLELVNGGEHEGLDQRPQFEVVQAGPPAIEVVNRAAGERGAAARPAPLVGTRPSRPTWERPTAPGREQRPGHAAQTGRPALRARPRRTSPGCAPRRATSPRRRCGPGPAWRYGRGRTPIPPGAEWAAGGTGCPAGSVQVRSENAVMSRLQPSTSLP